MPFYIFVDKCVEHMKLSTVAWVLSIQILGYLSFEFVKIYINISDAAWRHKLCTLRDILVHCLPGIFGLVTLKTTNSSRKLLLSQWGKKGKFLLFKMAVHNPSMEHKRVCRLGKIDGGPHACLNKKVFKPSSRSSSQGSMILKTGRELGLVNVMDRQKSLKAPRG